MRRTTICRFEAALLAALLISPATVTAQQQPAPAGQQPAATTPASLPPSHVVQAGETLWALAERYFGDPLLWPEIYRLNTDVIEDPAWIFPGEELRLVAPEEPPADVAAAPGNVAVAPMGDTAQAGQAQPQLPPSPNAPTVFAARPAPGPVRTAGGRVLEFVGDTSYRAVRAGEYYSAGFVTEGERLNTGRLLGNVEAAAIRRATDRNTATLFTDVLIRPPQGDSLRRGDLALILRRGREIRGFGEVMTPTGLVRITGAAPDGNVTGQVISAFGLIVNGQEVMPVAPFSMPSTGRPVDVTEGPEATVIGLRDQEEAATLQSVLFLDRGADDGVRLGDVFQISGPSRTPGVSGGAVREQARAMVVNVRSRTSTAVLLQVTQPDVRQGSAARVIRRLPS